MKTISPSDIEKSWEKSYDEMIAPLTDSTADIKQFIRQKINKVRKEVADKIKKDLLAIADAGEYEDLRREVCKYFENN